MLAQVPVVHSVDDLTSEWLGAALDAPVTGFSTVAIGDGHMSDSYRITLDYASGGTGPASVVGKFASTDPTSRASGTQLGIYEREVRFYQEIAPHLGPDAPAPKCYVSVQEPDTGLFTVILEDAAPAVQGDQIRDCSLDEARLAMTALAKVHAPLFGDADLLGAPWLNQVWPLNNDLLSHMLPGYFERFGDKLATEHEDVIRAFVPVNDDFMADHSGTLGLVHGDYRPDNMLFGGPSAPRQFVAVDWQTIACGPVMRDASYFLGTSLTVENRRAHEKDLLREYHQGLQAGGVTDFSWDDCWEGYRRQSFFGLLMFIGPAMLVKQTERGDRMFLTNVSRAAQHILDVDALPLLSDFTPRGQL